MIDYARASNREKWLRHPAMGDPSFDSFEKVGKTVHESTYPYEWTVNGSLFVDFDGTWYLYAGLYSYGCQIIYDRIYPRFEIYRSRDEGKSWERLGPGLEPDFYFDGLQTPSSICPDAVVMYDKKRGKYLLTYDWCTDNWSWEVAHDTSGLTAESGVAVAWGDTPAGPFQRVSIPALKNKEMHGRYGRFDRFYATTVIPRKNDYLALSLCDSGPNFAWSLAAYTAQTPEEGFSAPVLVLNADRNDYYPTPMEYFPAFVYGDTVYSPATSVAANRNYQFLFAAPLEEAHKPEAWYMVQDGSLWHSRALESEHYGIWGQTFSGCMDKNGNLRVMYPSRNEQDRGTLSVATRKWDEPFKNEFTISGHKAPSVSIVRDAYRTFELETEFELHGTADILFGFHGKIGADKPEADCAPNASSLTDYTALRVRECDWSLVDHGQVLLSGKAEKAIAQVRIVREEKNVSAWANGEKLFEAPLTETGFAPIGIRTDTFSVFTCQRLEVCGETQVPTFRYNDVDALLGGGVGDISFRTENGTRVGTDRVKWNAVGGSFSLAGKRGPEYGDAIVLVNGQRIGRINFRNDQPEEETVLFSHEMPYGRYGIELIPVWGKIPVPEMVIRQG